MTHVVTTTFSALKLERKKRKIFEQQRDSIRDKNKYLIFIINRSDVIHGLNIHGFDYLQNRKSGDNCNY